MDGRANILVVDDEESMRDSCQQALSLEGHKVEVAGDGATGLAMIQKEPFDVVILDLKMPGLSGMEVLKQIRQEDREVVVIVITGYATVESAVEAMKQGAYDFIPKPFTPESLRMIVERGLERRRLFLENVLLRAQVREKFDSEGVIGRSKAMQRVSELAVGAAASDTAVMISGEAGTGKELVARVIHSLSQRRDKPFIVVDCVAPDESLFESELFGQVRGMPDGATETKYGQLEAANGGTLFLDEVGSMPPATQGKFIRVLEEKRFARAGSSQEMLADVRVIATSTKDLSEAIHQQSMREDLFYRLSVVSIYLPPLRERRGDIGVLANYYLHKYNRKREKSVADISEGAMRVLTEYDWPGNVRELENVIERAVVFARGGLIEPTDLWYYDLSGEMG